MGLNMNSPRCNRGKKERRRYLITPKELNNVTFNSFGVIEDLAYLSPDCIGGYSC